MEPLHPDATIEAKNLLTFITEIQGNYILSAQHNYTNTGSKYSSRIEQLTGKNPLVWGSDFNWCYTGDTPAEYQHAGPLNVSDPEEDAYILDVDVNTVRENMIQEAIKQHKRGHIITLMWHSCFPTDGDCCDGNSLWAWNNRPDENTWNDLLTDGTELNSAWKKSVDKIAIYLKILKDNHIPVLWRPYHEMNGVWFWWCNQKGENGFRRLWVMLYKYLNYEHNLNNLLWVWNANAPRNIPGDEAFAYEDFYPGPDFVDILAADVYHNDYKQSHHDELLRVANGKPIALGEVGNIPEPELFLKQPMWTWIMPWGIFVFKNNSDDEIKSFYNNNRVISLQQVKRDALGNYKLN